MKLSAFFVCCMLVLTSSQAQTMQASPATASVNFVGLTDGAMVSSPFTVKFGVSGMKIASLGDLTPETGHHHLLINQQPVKHGEMIPVDAKHIHFGEGQTETSLKLAPGVYRLTLQFGDGLHRSYGAQMSKTITVTVT